MASSNRHWPSLFKSKPSNINQWQHADHLSSSIISSSCHRSPFSSGPGGCEERSPDPKPRWNPKPEQIRILEAIFNSGMVNPPRDEIRRIRAQLQEYGQVGDANVFYWFQNRKSRSKHKQRSLLQTKNNNNQSPPPVPSTVMTNTHSRISSKTAPSSSSSSSEKSSPKSVTTSVVHVPYSVAGSSFNHMVHDLSNSPTGSVNNNNHHQQQQAYFQTSQGQLVMNSEPNFLFPEQQQQQTANNNNNINGNNNNNNNEYVFSTTHHQGFYFSDLSNVVQIPDQQQQQEEADDQVGVSPGFLLSELMMSTNNQGCSKKVNHQDDQKMKLNHHNNQQLGYITSSAAYLLSPDLTTTKTTSATVTVPPNHLHQIQGAGIGVSPLGLSTARSTVFINDVAFEVSAVGSLNVRECFGDDAVLIHSTGQPVLTNDWGVTLYPLQHGAFYYLI